MSASKAVILEDDPDYRQEGGVVEFRLTYEGPLMASTNGRPRPEHKHSIRKAFHPQLKRLWEITPFLKEIGHPLLDSPILVNEKPTMSRLDFLFNEYRRGDYHFIPLVTEDLNLLCAIDILFLRPEPPGKIVQSGDVDGRLKTIVDALRIPSCMSEMGKGSETPTEAENPFYCLLQEDKLISKLSVTTDVLLESTGKTSAHPENDSRLVITVNVRPYQFCWANIPFGG